MAQSHTPSRRLVALAVVGGVAVLALGSYKVWSLAADDGPTTVPSCSWPLRVRGEASHEQAGLIRCYVRALATHDVAGLQAVAENDPPVRITAAQFRHTGDARAGTATATFVPNPSDNAYTTVKITYADGAADSLAIVLANPASAHSWRIQVGAETSTGRKAPPPLQGARPVSHRAKGSSS